MTFTEQDHMQECRVVTVNLINALNDYRHFIDTDEFKVVAIQLVGGMVLTERHSSIYGKGLVLTTCLNEAPELKGPKKGFVQRTSK